MEKSFSEPSNETSRLDADPKDLEVFARMVEPQNGLENLQDDG